MRDGTSFNIIHVATAVKIDVFIAGADPLDRERLRRRLSASIQAPGGETRLYVDTPEDVILRKLEWYRPAARGGDVSERQWRDVLAVFRVQRHLDAGYLRRWGARLDVSDLLDRASAAAASS